MNIYKKLVALSALISFMMTANAQDGVIISDNPASAPHAWVKLQVNSSDKGVLIPRMTIPERDLAMFNNGTPANGTLIFVAPDFDNIGEQAPAECNCFMYWDTTANSGAGAWIELATSNSTGPDADWLVSGVDMSTIPDGNVGIGVAVPTVKLDVDGAIRVNSDQNTEVITDAGGTVMVTFDDSFFEINSNPGIGLGGSSYNESWITGDDDGLNIGHDRNTAEGTEEWFSNEYYSTYFNDASAGIGGFGNGYRTIVSSVDNTILGPTNINQYNNPPLCDACPTPKPAYPVFVGGLGNSTNMGVQNSVVLGGQGIIADQNNTAFVEILSIEGTPNLATSNFDILVRDQTSGLVLRVDPATLGGGIPPLSSVLAVGNTMNVGQSIVFNSSATGFDFMSDANSNALVQINRFSQNDFTITTDNGAYAENALYLGSDGFDLTLFGDVNAIWAQDNSTGDKAGVSTDGIVPISIVSQNSSVKQFEPDGVTPVQNAVILGGSNIIADRANTAFVENLSIEGAPQLATSNFDVLVRDQISGSVLRVDPAALGGGSGGNFIPLSGTVTGAPVTGNIEMQNGTTRIYSGGNRLDLRGSSFIDPGYTPVLLQGGPVEIFGERYTAIAANGSYGLLAEDRNHRTSATHIPRGIQIAQLGSQPLRSPGITSTLTEAVGVMMNTEEGRIDAESFRSVMIGGTNNQIQNRTENAILINGEANSILTEARNATIIGGRKNTNDARNEHNIIIGGESNLAYEKSNFSAIINSFQGELGDSYYDVIIGGELNRADGRRGIAMGGIKNNVSGDDNAVIAGASNSVVARNSISLGGQENKVNGGSVNVGILGGRGNTISGLQSSVILGGDYLSATRDYYAYTENMEIQNGMAYYNDVPAGSINGHNYTGNDNAAIDAAPDNVLITKGWAKQNLASGIVFSSESWYSTLPQASLSHYREVGNTRYTIPETGNYIVEFSSSAEIDENTELDYVIWNETQTMALQGTQRYASNGTNGGGANNLIPKKTLHTRSIVVNLTAGDQIYVGVYSIGNNQRVTIYPGSITVTKVN